MTGETAKGAEALHIPLHTLPEYLDITERLALRKVQKTDFQCLFDIIKGNPDISKYVAWASKVHAAEDVVPRLQRYSNEEMDGRFVIIGNGSVVGYIGIHARNRGEYGIGYFLDSSARGNGYVTDAASALIEQARQNLQAEQIFMQIIPDNEASSAIPEHLGFHKAETVMGTDFPVEQQRWRLDLT
jgi:ribosomal-protein-serine acetyltransferase